MLQTQAVSRGADHPRRRRCSAWHAWLSAADASAAKAAVAADATAAAISPAAPNASADATLAAEADAVPWLILLRYLDGPSQHLERACSSLHSLQEGAVIQALLKISNEKSINQPSSHQGLRRGPLGSRRQDARCEPLNVAGFEVDVATF